MFSIAAYHRHLRIQVQAMIMVGFL